MIRFAVRSAKNASHNMHLKKFECCMLPGMKISASNLNDKQFKSFNMFYSKVTRTSIAKQIVRISVIRTVDNMPMQ